MSSSNLGIYIHIPFCEGKCPYCSFYSLNSEEELRSLYVQKVERELIKWGNTLKKPVDTIYFGGGTPSLMNSDKIVDILESINKSFHILDAEITIEVNPADYKLVDFEKLKFSGINRVSIGMQSLEDNELKILGRRHSANDVFSTYENAKKSGIENISVDFIIGTPSQTLKSLDRVVNFCKENNISHLSSYLLKIEENTPYYENSSLLNFLSDDECSDFYIYLSEKMEKLGYNHYEISNFAISGKESKHNLKYWNLEDYLGIGPSAHSLIGRKRFYYENNIHKFNNEAKIISEGLGKTEEEYLMLKLRLAKGLQAYEYEKKFGHEIPKVYFEKMAKYEALKLVIIDENGIKLTKKGFLLSNKVISDLIF